MTEISKRFEQLIAASQRKLTENNQILPVNSPHGILVGDVLIKSEYNLKNLWKRDRLVYKEVCLNDAAIRLANLLARNKNPVMCDRIYKADQDYSLWFNNWQFLKQQYHKALKNKEFDRADILFAKLEESKYKTEAAKKSVMALL